MGIAKSRLAWGCAGSLLGAGLVVAFSGLSTGHQSSSEETTAVAVIWSDLIAAAPRARDPHFVRLMRELHLSGSARAFIVDRSLNGTREEVSAALEALGVLRYDEAIPSLGALLRSSDRETR